MAKLNKQLPENVRFIVEQYKEGLGVTMLLYKDDNAASLVADLAALVDDLKAVPGWGGQGSLDERDKRAARRGAIAARLAARKRGKG